MKSLKQIPITHPTPAFLDAQLEETRDRLQRLKFCVDMLNWGREKKPFPWKVPMPVPSHLDTAWQTVVYLVETLDDYKKITDLYESTNKKIKDMLHERSGK